MEKSATPFQIDEFFFFFFFGLTVIGTKNSAAEELKQIKINDKIYDILSLLYKTFA